MAYKLMYNDGILFEPFSDDVVYDAKLTARYNNPDYLDFTIPYGHSLYSTVAERAGVVKLYFDNILLFDGEITSIEIDMEGNKSISCDGALAYLQDSLVRPYSTIKGEEQYTAPSTVNGLFQWYVDQHNEHVMDPRKQFTVEVNQGASLDTNNYIYRSNNGLPTTWSEINDKLIDSLGGYLFVDYEDTVHILNYYADVHENNTQIIDFGVNILDFSKTIDTTDQYTAVRPSGATPEAPEGSTEEQKPITIESLADGGTKYSDIVKKGDVVYSVDGVVRYGYREYHYSNTDITTQSGLLESACRVLNNLLSPTTTITVKAVDLSLYMEGYTHLKVGEAVRIRSKLHDEDEYLMVNSITLDLQNPGNSEYEIGQAYDTLTGQQSAYLKSLNSGINKSLDSVAALDTKAKETAEVAKTAAEQAEEAKQKAEEAETNSSAAQKAAEAAQTAAEKTVTEAKNAADKATDAAMAADEAKSKVTVIESNVTTKINEFNTKVDASTTASANAEKNASAALDKANDAYTSVGKIQSQVEHIDSAVKDVDTKATNIRDELAGQIETVTNTMTADYTKKSELSETTETLKKEITESAAGVKSEVALTYATKTDLATTTEATEAAKKAAQAAQDTANKNATDLANTIVKYDGKVEDLQSQIDGAIETWFYDGVPTTSNAPAKDWVDDKVKKNHLGDLYYDNKTGYSYRWQVQNGTYSWSRITDVDVTKALANAAKAQDTADNKRRVFVTTPKPPYDQGDLWVQGSGGDIMRCQTAKTSTQSYAAADWVLASKYTDDTGVDTLSNHVSTYYAAKSTVEQLADKWSVTNNSITQIQLDPEAAETEVANAKKAATEAKNNVTTAKSNLATAKTNLDTANANLEKAKADPSITYDQLDKFKTAAREAQVKYNAAVDAVTMAEAAVTVANNLVTAATDRLTAVQSLDNRITSNKTAIETNDKEIKLTASSLSTKIDGIAIGGCNLIQNSTGNLNKTTYWNTESGSCEVASVTTMDDYSGNCIKFVQSAAGGRFYFSANMFAHTNGQEYTLTFWAKSSSTVTFGAYEGGTTAITTASIDSSKWTKFQKTYTASTTYSLTLKASAATTVYIAKLKLESGNKATDWTPAPEDLLVNAETYSDAQLKITADTITSDVSKTYATQTALATTNANVTTAQSTANTAKSNAATAQNTANSKRRVFTATPTPPYDVGDLWVQGSTGDIKRCGTAKASGKTYAASDWVLASKYTDDTTANTAIANVKTLDSKVDQQIDKVTTYIRESSGNIMNGTADFSALTGGAWANSAIRVTGTATLAHGHNSTCPVPNSDQVVITATTANTLGGFCQDGYTDIIATDKLTISCYVKASVKGSKVQIQPFWNSTGVPSDYAKTITLSDTNWTYVTHTATASVTTTNSIGYVCLQSSTANAKLYVCGIKVERGTFASAWCASSTDLTNYMRFSSSGLEIAKKVNGSVGSTKAVITDSAFQIQNSSGTTLSSFGATDVELAMTSDTAYIYFCKKLGYIAGHNSSLLFYSKYMRVGTSSTSVHVGESADLVVVGNMADRASFGYLSPDVEVGGQSKSVKLGSLATTVDLGLSATTVDLGTNSTNVNVGSGATNVTVGSDSGTTTLNLKNRTINVGSSLNANGSNVHIYGPLYYRRSTSHTDHVILKATSLWSGTLSKGGSVTITQLQSWTLFGVLVTGYSVLLPMLSTGDGSLSASASYDDGSTSVSLKASFSISGTTLKLISASKHVFDTTVAGTSLNVYRIYGIF